MLDESRLKERLAYIAQNDYCVTDEAEVWPLVQRMMDSLGSTDPELRDRLIYTTLFHWSEQYLDAPQLRALLEQALDDMHLFHGLGEQGTDSVFMRSFSLLTVAAVLYRHRARGILTAEQVGKTRRRLLAYLARERDVRGYVEGKGWAHAAAHAADALDELAQCTEVGADGLQMILQAIGDAVVQATGVFSDEEDERLVVAVLNALERRVLADADVREWIRGVGAFETPPAYRDWLRRKINVKHFLRSLYFASRDRGLFELLEPALGETLHAVSHSRFSAAH